MKVARVVARHAVVVALVFVALSPTSVLAFTPPAPGNPGNHFGELLHNPHMQTTPGGGGGNGGGSGSSGVGNVFSNGTNGGESTPSISVPAIDFQPASGGGFTALTAAFNVGQDSLFVVLILAALIAGNVALGVLYIARGGNYVLRLATRPVTAAA